MKIANIKAIRQALGLTLTDAVNFEAKVQLPFVLLDGVDLDTANSVRDALSRAGCSVDIEESSAKQPMIFFRPDLLSRDHSYSDVKSPVMRAIYRILDPRR